MGNSSMMPPDDLQDCVTVADWRYLAEHLDEEVLADVHSLLDEWKSPRLGAKLVEQLDRELPGTRSKYALLVALARMRADRDSDQG
jgi:hypothetical protein